MNLVIDIGNTRCKWAIFEGKTLLTKGLSSELNTSLISEILRSYTNIEASILSSVKSFPKECRTLIESAVPTFIELNYTTPIPIKNGYETPQTLGRDRLAAAIGAHKLFPNNPLLVIDAGTAITIDFVSKSGEFIGGNITPGLQTRFKSLHEFTGKLPLIWPADEFDFIGKNTESAIRAGVQLGIFFEIESYISHFKANNPDLITLLTGGDAIFIAQHINADVHLNEELTLNGLNEILHYNSGLR